MYCGTAAGGDSLPRVRTAAGTGIGLLSLLLAQLSSAGEAPAPAGVDGPRIAAADREPGSWLAHGRTYSEQRFSPLREIHSGNVSQLGLAWSYATGTKRGLEATPIVVDGVLYATGSWSVVYALDAATGSELWRYDPEVPKAKGRDACCDVVNRGVAVWKGRVYVGALDGRLIALDARNGKPVWSVLTIDPAKPYTITGAPRVVKDRVIIGNGGAEFGVRGYFTAYDAATGRQLWRFFTVPGPPSQPYEHAELEVAAKTWSTSSRWETGLGGTVWDSMAYDPELDLLYVGVGNSSLYNRELRSPGGGDNLFLSSILAVRPESGKLVWHYQTTPGEYWDYTSTQHMILADLEIEGRLRQVLMQAPKNGFFYVLDRATGELLSVENYVPVSWATHVDLKTGRPVEREEAYWGEERAVVTPSLVGGHNWHPMSFSPMTGLVYIPTIAMAYPFVPKRPFKYVPRAMNTGEDYAGLDAWLGPFAGDLRFCSPTHITAWDPARQRQVWRVSHDHPVPGGLLSTAGNLVFQGTGSGRFAAYDSATGERLWESQVGVGIMAPPVTYRVKGTQYVAVMAGIGGTPGLNIAPYQVENDGRLIAYKLGGSAKPLAVTPRVAGVVDVPESHASKETIEAGRGLYSVHCMRCHGLGAQSNGALADLRHSTRAIHDSWESIVLGGTHADRGMASFADLLAPPEVATIHSYVIAQARRTPELGERLARWVMSWGCVPASWLAD